MGQLMTSVPLGSSLGLVRRWQEREGAALVMPVPYRPLPRRMHAAVADALAPGERVLWLGRPGRGMWPGTEEASGGAALLMVAGFWVAFIMEAVNAVPGGGLEGDLRRLFVAVLPSLPVPVLAWVGCRSLLVPLRMRRALARTVYAVTNHRVMAVVVDPEGQADRVSSVPLLSIAFTDGPDTRRGDVRVGTDDLFDWPTVVLFRVERPGAVARLIRAQSRECPGRGIPDRDF